jgi:hypothetical protein
MERPTKIALLCALIPVAMTLANGCTHQQPVDAAPSERAVSMLAGCYQLRLSRSDFGPVALYPRPPRTLFLTTERETRRVREGYVARAVGQDSMPDAAGHGVWLLKPGGAIAVYWGFEMTGTAIDLSKRDGYYAGTAASYSDLSMPRITADAELRRTPCNPDGGNSSP